MISYCPVFSHIIIYYNAFPCIILYYPYTFQICSDIHIFSNMFLRNPMESVHQNLLQGPWTNVLPQPASVLSAWNLPQNQRHFAETLTSFDWVCFHVVLNRGHAKVEYISHGGISMSQWKMTFHSGKRNSMAVEKVDFLLAYPASTPIHKGRRPRVTSTKGGGLQPPSPLCGYP